MSDPPVLLVLDLAGTFAFALNGALTAVRTAHLDIVGVITLGMITAVGGGIIRDVLLGALPPATFVDWRYLAVAAGGGLIAFLFSRWLTRVRNPIDVLDAAGLSLFAITWTPTLSATTTSAAPTRAGIGTVRCSTHWEPAGSARPAACRRPPPVTARRMIACAGPTPSSSALPAPWGCAGWTIFPAEGLCDRLSGTAA
jgi:hypothetical protein